MLVCAGGEGGSWGSRSWVSSRSIFHGGGRELYHLLGQCPLLATRPFPPHPPRTFPAPLHHEAGLAELVGDRPVQTLGFPRGERGARPGAAGGCGFSGRIGTMEEIAPPASPPSPHQVSDAAGPSVPVHFPVSPLGRRPDSTHSCSVTPPRLPQSLLRGPRFAPPPPNQVTSRGRIPPPAGPAPFPRTRLLGSSGGHSGYHDFLRWGHPEKRLLG